MVGPQLLSSSRADHHPPRRVRAPADSGIDRLGLDHVDLLLIHWPTDIAPIEATVEALADQQDRERTRLVGVSNPTAAQLQRAAKVADVATNQVEYHPLLGQSLVLYAVRSEDAFLTAYSPLAHGALFADNLAALDVELTDEQVTQLDALPKDRRQIDPSWAPDWD